jgi:hypothetical protein
VNSPVSNRSVIVRPNASAVAIYGLVTVPDVSAFPETADDIILEI